MVSTNLKFEKANLSKDTKIITFDFNAQRTGKRYKLRLSNPNKCSYGCKIDWFIERFFVAIKVFYEVLQTTHCLEHFGNRVTFIIKRALIGKGNF